MAPATSSPFCTSQINTLASLKSAVKRIPSIHQSTFTAISDATVYTLCNPKHLHVWEISSHIDDLLQLSQLVLRLKSMMTYVPAAGGMGKCVFAGAVLIVGQEKENCVGTGHFERVCEMMKYLVAEEGTPHLEGKARSFGNVAVVRGMNTAGPYDTENVKREAKETVGRVNKTIFKILDATGTQKLVWHSGPAIHFVKFWLSNTTTDMRSALAGISITGALLFRSTSISLSSAAQKNTQEDMDRLSHSCNKLGISVTFVDAHPQGLDAGYLDVYCYYWGYYAASYLASSIHTAHFHAAMDELVLFCFQLYGAAKQIHGADMVEIVKEHLSPRKAKVYAKKCVDKKMFTRELCRSAGKDESINHAAHLADAPVLAFRHGVEGLARMSIGPAGLDSASFDAVPISLSLSSSSQTHAVTMRIQHPTPFRLWIPNPSIKPNTILERVQGTLTAVLSQIVSATIVGDDGTIRERVIRGVHAEGRASWGECVRACLWALRSCEGRLPKEMAEKVQWVEARLGEGVFTSAVKGAW